MRFVVTGGAGNVSRPLAYMLLAEGHGVVSVGRTRSNLDDLVERGAEPAIGSFDDGGFLSDVFSGADGVYLMLPPMWDAADQKLLSVSYALNFARAVRVAGVRRVVFLSSYGAHRLLDAGPISGMGLAELILNDLEGVDVLHLRAGYFYTNLLLSIPSIRKTGNMGNMFEVPEGRFTVVDPEDIAAAAAAALTARKLGGKAVRYVVSDETSTNEIAALIGQAVGLPSLSWLKIPKEDLRHQLRSYGFAEGAAADYVEMFETLDRGLLFDDYFARGCKPSGTTIEAFAKIFARHYRRPGAD